MSKTLTLPIAPVAALDSQDQDDLHIVEYLNQDQLPELLRLMLSRASTPAEQDMLLMSTLTAASAVLPNLYFRYGNTGKKYYANLQCFILAAAASGKGIANQALEMLEPVQEQYPVLIPGDSTFPAFFKRLHENGGRGYVHESEGTVITDIWKSQAATYSSILRKAAEHEMVSNNRVKEMKVIPNPQLSVLLTGTFSQYNKLVPSIENGYFSRLLPIVIRDTQPFNRSIVEADGHSELVSRQVGQQLLNLCRSLSGGCAHEWSLTADQKSRLGSHLATQYTTLINLLGANFHSAVIRMAVQIERIAMILSALRLAQSSSRARSVSSELLTCSDADYATAELIGNKLILHMASAYKMIAGDKTELVPSVATTCQKQLLFTQLPDEYAHKLLVIQATTQGISSATAARWNEKWLELGMIKKVRYGIYQKVS